LKEDRGGLKKLIELAKRRQIDAVIAHKDRLTRFGFEYLVELFKAYGVNVVVASQDDKDYTQELGGLRRDRQVICLEFTAKSMRRW
jgi:predicted site-specific integrase-resolvase